MPRATRAAMRCRQGDRWRPRAAESAAAGRRAALAPSTGWRIRWPAPAAARDAAKRQQLTTISRARASFASGWPSSNVRSARRSAARGRPAVDGAGAKARQTATAAPGRSQSAGGEGQGASRRVRAVLSRARCNGSPAERRKREEPDQVREDERLRRSSKGSRSSRGHGTARGRRPSARRWSPRRRGRSFKQDFARWESLHRDAHARPRAARGVAVAARDRESRCASGSRRQRPTPRRPSTRRASIGTSAPSREPG